MKQRPFLSSAFVHRSPISFHSFFFLLFSLFFLLSFFFHKLWQSVFLFFSSAFVLLFPCVSNAARRCQQRSRTGRSTPLVLNPSPSPPKVLLNRGWSIRVSGKLFTYPSSKPPLTLTSHLGQNVGLREGVGRQFPKKINWSDDSMQFLYEH